MADHPLTIKNLETVLSQVFKREFDSAFAKAFDAAFEKAFDKAFDTALNKAIEQKIEPLVRGIVKESAEKIVADVSQAIDNFISSTDGRFTAIEYDISKNKQDITTLNKTANLAFYRPR